MAQLQVLAGAGRVVLSTQGVLHLLDLHFQRVEGAKDLLHAISVVHVIVWVALVHELARVNVALVSLRGLHGQRVDDITRRTLGLKENKSRQAELIIY